MSNPQPAVEPYAPNYAWVGAPAIYNGTGKTGGNSGKNLSPLHNTNSNSSISQPSRT